MKIKVEVLLNTAVKSVGPTDCTLGDGRKLPFGLMVSVPAGWFDMLPFG